MNETYWHLAAYYATLTNGSTNAPVAAVSDSVLTLASTNFFLLPRPGKLEAIYSAGVSLTRARINTPSLRYVGLPYGGPVNATLAVPSPYNFTYWGEDGPAMPFGDQISVEHTLGGAAPEAEFSVVFFRFARREQPAGPTYNILFTGTITGVTGAWANGAMTPDSTLPAGKYAITGMHAFGTNLVAARLIFPGTTWRPGVIANNANNGVPMRLFTDGTMGVYGTFSSVNVPNLEVFVIGANTAQTVFLELVRISDQP